VSIVVARNGSCVRPAGCKLSDIPFASYYRLFFLFQFGDSIKGAEPPKHTYPHPFRSREKVSLGTSSTCFNF